MATVDALARLVLQAHRLGLGLRLVETPRELGELIAFAGLAEALCVEAWRETEKREETLGVQEERQLGDTAG